MITRHNNISTKTIKTNFDNIFNHLNRYYLGSRTHNEIDSINRTDLPYGAIVYDTTNHILKVLSDENGTKIWKNISY